METDIIKKIEDTEKKFSTYYEKLDDDFKLWDLVETKYEVHETAINVTTNEPRLFADAVQTDLASSEMQITVRTLEVEGEDKRDEASKLERLLYFLLEKADVRLIDLLLPPMKETLIWLFLIRGAAGASILNYMKDGKIVPDYRALDPRWFTYAIGKKGFAWTAYKSYKTEEMLEADWNYKPKNVPFYTPWVKKNDVFPFYDYWKMENGKAVNKILCEKEVIHSESYNLDAIPILFMPATSRMPVVTTGDDEQGRYGESIFASKRAMYKLSSKLATTWATHAQILAKQPLLNYIDDESLRLDSTVMFAEGVLNLVRGKQEIQPSPLKEISPTLINLVAFVEDKIERGQTPSLKLGSPPPSGTALNLYREAGNRIYNPQVRVLSHFYAGICRMIEEQLLMGGVGKEKIKKIKVEAEKDSKYFAFDITPVDLKKPHKIKVEFTVKTPFTQLDVAQLADMLKRLGLPDRWIWEFILKVPDPKLLEDLAVLEVYEHSPEGMMKRAIEVLMKYGYVFEATKLNEQMGRIEAQEKMAVGGGMPPPGEEVLSPPPGEGMGAGI